MANLILSVDAGTTSTKAALFNEEGRCLSTVTQEYELIAPDPVTLELDVQTYWRAASNAVRQIVEKSGTAPQEIAALGISSQGETLICLDEKGNPLRRAIVWLDNRSAAQAVSIREEFGLERFYRTTGQPEIVPTWPATKILWLREHEPEVFARTVKFLLVEDYLIYRLTGRYVTEPSMVSSSGYFQMPEWDWWDEMLSFLGVGRERLPEVLHSGTTVGPLTPEAAQELGLDESTIVSTGAMDQVCAMIGSGNITPGTVTESTGAALAVCATVTAPTYDEKMRLPCHCHGVSGRYMLMSWNPTSGMVLKWFRDKFCSDMERDKSMSYDLMCAEARQVPPGCEGLIMLPYLSGVTSPEFNPNARGVFFGFTLGHSRRHFIRSIIEAVAYMLRANLEVLRDVGIDLEEILSVGGAARSDFWCQVKADVIGKPVLSVDTDEAACRGAALLAGVAAGIYSDLQEATSRGIAIRRSFLPDNEKRAVYDQGYAAHWRLYESTQDLLLP